MLLLLLFLSYMALSNSLNCINTDGNEKKSGNEDVACWCANTYCLIADDFCKVDTETERGNCFSCHPGKKVVPGTESGSSTQICRDCAESVR